MSRIQYNEFQEGEIFNKWLNSRLIVNNKNVLGANLGATGCLAGDTIINTSRNEIGTPLSIKHLYIAFNGGKNPKQRKGWNLTKPTFVRSFNGEIIRLNKIKKVLYSGKKKVYLLKLENGLSIKATSEHKFLTKGNGWVELCNLKEKEVMCDTLNSESSNRKRIKMRDIGLCVGKNHPYNTQPNGQIPVHILIYESRMNNLTFLQYLDLLLNEPERCKELKYINPSIQTIHHKDCCHYNNSIENLELLPRKEHYFKHNEYTNFSQGIPKFSRALSIEYIGEEDTYDIECEEPNHNFVANGMVVHNSGKSYRDLRMAELWYLYHFKEQLPIENICFGVGSAMNLISKGKLRKGEILIFEEAGVNLGSLDFQQRISKMMNYVLQSFRSMNIAIFFNLPYLSMLNSSARKLLHYSFESVGVDKNSKLNTCKPFFHQVNQDTGKVYKKYPIVKINGKSKKIKRFAFSLPSQYIVDAYEEKKRKYLLDLTAGFKEEIDKVNNKGKIPIPNEEEIQAYVFREQSKSWEEIASLMGRDRKTIVRWWTKVKNFNELRAERTKKARVYVETSDFGVPNPPLW